jgi:acetylglutamate/LysW-gamma-L-alpha-aminoadipate kinase
VVRVTVVVKVGGARAVDPEGALADVATLYEEGEDVDAAPPGRVAAVTDTTRKESRGS